MKNDVSQFLSPDKPLDNPEFDAFNYAPLAERLAKSIVNMTPPDGLVIGIYGEWGLGKSTFIKFILHYLEKLPDEEQPIIVHFNPWWFAGSEHLVKQFFGQLHAILRSRLSKSVKGLLVFLKTYGDIISENTGSGVIKAVSNLIPDFKNQDVYSLKSEVAKALKKQKKRIVVVIDDIDRLSPDEIRQVFTVIKAIADFPNVIYLVAFDKAVVTKALDDRGAEYLEKIVQVPFELPLPSKVQLQKLLLENLERVIGEVPRALHYDVSEFFQAEIIPYGYLQYIQQIVDTPRKVARLTNALTVTYSAVKGEVDPTDFIAIETIRVFIPELYDEIRRRKETFVGSNQSEADRSYFDSFTSQKWYTENIATLLKQLFPKIDTRMVLWDTSRALRIRNPRYYDTYFRLTISSDDVSISELQTILAHADNAKSLVKQLDDFAEHNSQRVTSLLQRIVDDSPRNIPEENIDSVVAAILDIGDRLLYEPNGSLRDGSTNNEEKLKTLIITLLKRVADRNQQFQILSKAMTYGTAHVLAIKLIIMIEHMYGRFGSSQVLHDYTTVINKDNIPDLENIAVEKIHKVIERDDFFAVHHTVMVLRTWVLLEPEDAKKWIHEALKSPTNLFSFVYKFMGRDASSDINSIGVHKDIELYVDLSTVTERVENVLGKTTLSEDQVLIANEFLKASRKPLSDAIMNGATTHLD